MAFTKEQLHDMHHRINQMGMTDGQANQFDEEWKKTVVVVKKSKADLSKINLTTDEKDREKARYAYAQRRKKRLQRNV